ncbi:MAG: polysaccharide deacetylase family protein [bacterium]|nr:polysaccharide deacetylase family protein [bacterium]
MQIKKQGVLLLMLLMVDAFLANNLLTIWKQETRELRAVDLPLAEAIHPKQVALTFDDGPHGEFTPLLLDGLKERGVKATFFLMGKNIEGNEEIVKRMQQEGHLIGSHSYQHLKMTKEKEEDALAEISKNSRLIASITGQYPTYLRPPYGDWNEHLENEVPMTTVFWSVDSLDWKYQNIEKTVQQILKDTEEGDIILMHDIFETSVEAALEVIDRLEEQGYTFVTVDEMLIE